MSDRITLVGTIATAPNVIGSGTPTQLCTFRLASNDRRYNRDNNEWVDGPTNWFTVNAFRGLGEHAQASLQKGDRVMVHGRLRVRNWETESKRGTAVEVDAEALGHDLRWGTSAFTKLTHSTSKSEDLDSAGTSESAGTSDSTGAPDSANAPDGTVTADPPPPF